ncbi:MAG TPA: PKD domain-containing protein [Burkholderiales bacterium]
MKTIKYLAVAVVLALALAGCDNNQGSNNPPAAGNNQPVADAGPDQASNVLVGDVVVLDGSASNDADGDTLNYVWTLTTVPPDSAATLSDPFSDKPTFIADKAGTYGAQLTVNDGKADSASDDINATVVVPPPTVTIATPVPQTIATENPVMVAGTVDDPSATVTVAGDATVNNNGAYSANVTLVEGENSVTVVATNSTGEGSASVDVTLRTARGLGPAMTIAAPKPDFTAGAVWDDQGAAPSNNIPVTVTGTATTNQGPPTVMVNNVAATISPLARNPLLDVFCFFFPNRPACDQRYNFAADIQLSKGPQTIAVIGKDAVGGSTTVAVNGVADYCLIGLAEPGVAAERGNGQNNRCHFVDGCSAPGSGDDSPSDARRNQPMPGADHNLVPVEFGSGPIPPSEFFVHGQSPEQPLGCNIHDNCYQTCVPQGDGARVGAYNACNLQQRENHKAMCRKAYPACPYTGLESFKCVDWAAEKATCFALAESYFVAVEAGGFIKYNARQNDFCLN